MFTFLAICSTFNGENAKVDKNGKMPVALQPIAGTSPRGLNILSGSVAENTGFEAGKTYLILASERPADERHGRQFNYAKLGEASLMETIAVKKELGDVKLLIAVGAESTATASVGAEA